MYKRFLAAGIMVFILALTAIGCRQASADIPASPATAVPVPYSNLAADFVKNSTTFQFDGLDGSIKLAKAQGSDNEMEFTIEYQTSHAGHGDRTGLMLAQVITSHTAVITVNNGEVISAVCDGTWDMLKY